MTLLATIESDLAAAGGWLETEAEDVATSAWSFLGTLFKQFEAGEVAILAAAAQAALADVTTGVVTTALDPAAAVTALLNQVELAEASLVAKITGEVAQAFLGIAGMQAAGVSSAPAA